MEITQEVLDVCVLIPCYNNQEGLIKSLQSISYTYNKYCVVVVDDGSKQPVVADNITDKDGRLIPAHVIRLNVNSGITNALNAGLSWIQKNLDAKYIARLDCGDICHPERFYKQIKFLDQSIDVGLVGCWCTFSTPENVSHYMYTTPTSHNRILAEMHFRNVFIHPGVIFRTSLLATVGLYPENYQHVEDYAFFWKILERTKGAILSEPLVTCEINSKGISMSHRRKQLLARKEVVNNFANNRVLKVIGIIKLNLLLRIPYGLILWLKYKIN